MVDFFCDATIRGCVLADAMSLGKTWIIVCFPLWVTECLFFALFLTNHLSSRSIELNGLKTLRLSRWRALRLRKPVLNQIPTKLHAAWGSGCDWIYHHCPDSWRRPLGTPGKTLTKLAACVNGSSRYIEQTNKLRISRWRRLSFFAPPGHTRR